MSILQELRDNKFLRDIDIYFAKNIAESFEVPEAELLFALIFKATEGGNTCLDTSNAQSFEFYERYSEHIDKVLNHEFINELMSKKIIAEAPATDAPFIRVDGNIYMKSFYSDEKSVSDFISSMASDRPDIDTERLSKLIDKYFKEDSMQKAAALNAALNRLTVISGGPGTGKTSTVFSLTALLCEMADKKLKIAVCAPTGKAAARLTETVAEKRKDFSDKNILEQIPEKALTIHRLLGMTGDSKSPLYNSANLLPYDLLIVDEASMVDVRLMAKLTEAMKPGSRLILMGDKDQLASVQPGAVLGDICANAPVESFSDERAKILSAVAGKTLQSDGTSFSDITVMLDKSWRYNSDKGIGLLAESSGRGDYKTAIEVMKNDSTGVVDFIPMSDDFEAIISRIIISHFKSYKDAETPFEAIELFNKFRILTPHWKQMGGTDHINTLAHKSLFKEGFTDNTRQFYHGMPLMITENDYSQNLFNGETGLIIGKGENCKAHFTEEDSKTRLITPARLPGHVTAFSMTVHKSQGSEFEHVFCVLPETDSKILTRELFYTAVTRAKKRLTIISTEKAVADCIQKKTKRASGLFSN